jgi:hypothetical protein
MSSYATTSVANPDPRGSASVGKLDPDPRQSEKQDPDPLQSEKVERSLRGSFWSIGGSKSEKIVSGRIRIRIKLKGSIRIRIRVKGRIRISIRIKVMQIRNTGYDFSYHFARFRSSPGDHATLFYVSFFPLWM